MTLERLPRLLLHMEGRRAAGGRDRALHPSRLQPARARVARAGAGRVAARLRCGTHARGPLPTTPSTRRCAPIVLGTIGVLAEADVAVQLALIWLAHIGVDRALGYGLKYPTGRPRPQRVPRPRHNLRDPRSSRHFRQDDALDDHLHGAAVHAPGRAGDVGGLLGAQEDDRGGDLAPPRPAGRSAGRRRPSRSPPRATRSPDSAAD